MFNMRYSYIKNSYIKQGVRAASHVHLVVAELCCGTPCQLPAERWELAGKTKRQSSIQSSAIVKSCQVLKKLYRVYITEVLTTRYFFLSGASYFVIYNIECKIISEVR